MRYTEYHCGVPVIKDKALLEKALEKLAWYEDIEEDPNVDAVIQDLIKAKNDALSIHSRKRINKGIRWIVKLSNFHEAAEDGLIERHKDQMKDLLAYIDQVDGSVTDDPVALIREYVEERL